MRDRIDTVFADRINRVQIAESKLRALLEDWGLVGDPDTALECYFMLTDYHILPDEWLRQPEWFRRSFHVLRRVEEFHERQKGKPDPATLPKLFKD